MYSKISKWLSISPLVFSLGEEVSNDLNGDDDNDDAKSGQAWECEVLNAFNSTMFQSRLIFPIFA